MSSSPNWLPEPLQYGDFNGDWDRFLEAVYAVFERDFKHSRPTYDGRVVVHDDKLDSGKEKGFWHISSNTDKQTGERLPDLRRCERIPWPRPMIDNSHDSFVSVWKTRKQRQMRVHLWLEPLEYLIVLAERTNFVVLITAFITDRGHTKRKLQREREKYHKKQTPP